MDNGGDGVFDSSNDSFLMLIGFGSWISWGRLPRREIVLILMFSIEFVRFLSLISWINVSSSFLLIVLTLRSANMLFIRPTSSEFEKPS